MFRFIAVVLLVLSARVASAAQWALLIGVGKYQDPGLNLPGIDLDVRKAGEMIRLFGVPPANTRILLDQAAGIDSVRAGFAWLAQNAKAGDRVYVYYSGHGTQVPDREPLDEEDGKDEAIVVWEGRNGILIDDEIGTMIEKIASKQVILLMDSCHSGTVAKGMSSGGYFRPDAPGSYAQSKYVEFDFAEKDTRSIPPTTNQHVSMTNIPGSNYLGVMAVQESEYAQATGEGSVLTNALYRKAIAAKGKLTIEELWQQAVEESNTFMQAHPGKGSLHPMLFGNTELARGINLLAGATATPGPNSSLITEWEQRADRGGLGVSVKVSRPVFPAHPDPTARNVCDYSDNLVTITVDIPGPGYVNIVNAGEGDEKPTIVFPNGWMQNNHFDRASALTLSPDPKQWCLPAALPSGMGSQKNLVAVFFSQEPLNLYKEAPGLGRLKELPEEVAARSIPPSSNQPGSGSSGVTYQSGKAFFTIRR